MMVGKTRKKHAKTAKKAKQTKQTKQTKTKKPAKQAQRLKNTNYILLYNKPEPKNIIVELKSSSKPIIYGRVHWNDCYHCKMMNPYWNTLKQRLRTHVPSHEMFDIERSEFDEKSNRIQTMLEPTQKLEINGYPTMFKIENRILTYFDRSKHAKHNSMEDKLFDFYTIRG